MTRASDLAKLIGAGATINDGTTITTDDNTDQLTLISTDADASRGPRLALTRNSGSPADNDVAGTIKFNAKNDAAEDIELFEINTTITDASDGTEDSKMTINGIIGGASTNRLNLTNGEAVFNDDSVDLDFRVESNGNANMVFVDGGNDKVGIGNNNPNDFGSTAADLVIGTTSGEHGLTIASGTGNGGRIQFADNTSSPFRGAFEYDHSSDTLILYTAGSARTRVDSGGTFMIGTTSGNPGQNNTTTGTAMTASGRIFMNNSGADSIMGRNSDGTLLSIRRSGSEVGGIDVTSSGTTYATSSDYRLKENVTADWNATTRLKQLNPVRFNFIVDADNTVDGFLAHEVQSIVPEAITGKHNGVDEDGNPVYQGIDQSKLVPLLVKTIQELEARITALESK